jgi:hypothetical protein
MLLPSAVAGTGEVAGPAIAGKVAATQGSRRAASHQAQADSDNARAGGGPPAAAKCGKLLSVRRSPGKLVLLMMLAVQLTVGFQWQFAAAAPAGHHVAGVATAAAPVAGDSAEHCASHVGHHPLGTQDHGGHDCCHAGACQCHCVYTPGLVNFPPMSLSAAAPSTPAPPTSQIVPTPIDEFLRPPIA